MSDRCETCGWFESRQCRRNAPRPYPWSEANDAVSFKVAGWVDVSKDDGCGEHTAVQRRRDRLMLAGQAMTGVVLHSSRSTAELSGELAAVAFALADAVLERADG